MAIATLADKFQADETRLDVLVNKVGSLYADRWAAPDGYEATLAMNVVGPFALTLALLPMLRATPGARVVNLASSAHTKWQQDPFEDLQAKRSDLGMRIYARAKPLNILWNRQLAE